MLTNIACNECTTIDIGTYLTPAQPYVELLQCTAFCTQASVKENLSPIHVTALACLANFMWGILLLKHSCATPYKTIYWWKWAENICAMFTRVGLFSICPLQDCWRYEYVPCIAEDEKWCHSYPDGISYYSIYLECRFHQYCALEQCKVYYKSSQ